jgi:hypothetical protein
MSQRFRQDQVSSGLGTLHLGSRFNWKALLARAALLWCLPDYFYPSPGLFLEYLNTESSTKTHSITQTFFTK